MAACRRRTGRRVEAQNGVEIGDLIDIDGAPADEVDFGERGPE
jgi:hypothetical protein